MLKQILFRLHVYEAGSEIKEMRISGTELIGVLPQKLTFKKKDVKLVKKTKKQQQQKENKLKNKIKNYVSDLGSASIRTAPLTLAPRSWRVHTDSKL